MQNQIITFATHFLEDSNQAEISKILTIELDKKNPDPINLTAVHQNYLYEDYQTSKLNFIRITGKYLRVREAEVFHFDHKLLKTLDNLRLENFMIWLYEMKTPSYNKFKEWSEILETDTLGVMDVSYDKGNSQKYYDDQIYVDFSIILKPTEFKNISNKLLNKKNDVEYDFYFDVENLVDDPPKKNMSYTNPILDFKMVKRKSLY